MKTSTPEPPRRLVVLAPNWLGDAVMALPLVADIRRGWPDTEIAVAARRTVAPLFTMVPAVSHTLTLEVASGLQMLAATRRNAELLAGASFDAALLLPNSFQSAWIASRAGIRERWGFPRDLRGRLLTRAIDRPPRHVHQAAYYQRLGAGLGLPVGEPFARLVISDADRAAARELLDQSRVAEGRFVVLAPGAAYGKAKQWPPERFAELATLLSGEAIATVLVGAAADVSACREVAGLAQAGSDSGTGSVAIADLSGRTDLRTLVALASLSHGVVANDSGAMHLAAAVGARVVAVFGPTDERKTSPLRAGPDAPEPAIVRSNVWCRPCMLRECPIDHRCMTGISARTVFELVA